MGKEFHIIGHPGTGKTTRIVKQGLPKSIQKYGPDKVALSSFSKTAAEEIAQRVAKEGIEINKSHVGTLHSLCYRMLDYPKLVNKYIDDWNNEYPRFSISGKTVGSLDEAEPMDTASIGSQALATVEINRAKLRPIEVWPQTARHFYKLWVEFKKRVGAVDFTDLIETCLKGMPYAPGQPDIMIIDEAQDFNPLQIALVRSWAQQMDSLVLVYDSNQCIFSFTGATPEVFTTTKPFSKEVLGQSYRVPQKVLNVALKVIGNARVKEDSIYLPRTDAGVVVEGSASILKEANYKNPGAVIEYAKNKISDGKSVMILATCAYMLKQVQDALINEGVPFHNEYRLFNKNWNPLSHGTETIVTSRDIVSSFMDKGPDENYWNVQQFLNWTKDLAIGENGLIRGNGRKGLEFLRQKIKEGSEGLHTSRAFLSKVLSPNAIEYAMKRDLSWLKANTSRKSVDFPIRVVEKYGIDAINKKPLCTIGTCHSVKGGESDCVIIFPDWAYAAHRDLFGQLAGGTHPIAANWDSMYRLFYVAITRAKEEVVFCSPIKYESQFPRRLYMDFDSILQAAA